MQNTIIQQLLDGVPIDALNESIEAIPTQHIVDTITTIDVEFKKHLVQYADIVHVSMQSHYTMGTIATISKEFTHIKKYLTCIVREHLPLHQRVYISFVEFFTDTNQGTEIEHCIKHIEKSQQELLNYTQLLIFKAKDFLKYLEAYQQWLTLLTRFVPHITENYGTKYTELSYLLSKITLQASEFLMTQRQLESTIKLQIQNNQSVMTDTLHVLSVSQSLIHNTISAQQFFKQEYIKSITTLKKYTGK